MVEIPVEPWTEVDFRRVAAKGAEALNVSFSEEMLTGVIRASFSSIGVFQELLKGICGASGITETQQSEKKIMDMEKLNQTIRSRRMTTQPGTSEHLKQLPPAMLLRAEPKAIFHRFIYPTTWFGLFSKADLKELQMECVAQIYTTEYVRFITEAQM